MPCSPLPVCCPHHICRSPSPRHTFVSLFLRLRVKELELELVTHPEEVCIWCSDAPFSEMVHHGNTVSSSSFSERNDWQLSIEPVSLSWICLRFESSDRNT